MRTKKQFHLSFSVWMMQIFISEKNGNKKNEFSPLGGTTCKEIHQRPREFYLLKQNLTLTGLMNDFLNLSKLINDSQPRHVIEKNSVLKPYISMKLKHFTIGVFYYKGFILTEFGLVLTLHICVHSVTLCHLIDNSYRDGFSTAVC